MIRDGTGADWDAIAALHAESWRDSYRAVMPGEFLDGPVHEDRRERWRERLADRPPRSVLLIAEVAGVPAGFLYAFPDEDRDRYLLDNLHVARQHRSAGIGETLMRAAAARLAAIGSARLLLHVIDGNDGACRFYERLGGVRQPVEYHGFRGLGPFAMIPFRWEDFSTLSCQV